MTSLGTTSELPLIRIRAGAKASPLDLAELARHGDLLWTLADRDVRVRYKQTALGVLWVVLQPLLAALIFTFIFGVVAKLPSDGVPYILFAFAGLIAWNAFAAVVTRAGTSLTSNATMISKIYFPRLLLPLSTVGAAAIDFLVSLGMMAAMMGYYRVWPGWPLLLLPAWVAALLAMALGIGLAAGAIMVRYRDVAIILPVALQMMMYLSPVAWSLSAVPERYRWILLANPLAGLLEAVRWSLLGQGGPSPWALAYSLAASALVFWGGTVVFKQQERAFADVI